MKTQIISTIKKVMPSVVSISISKNLAEVKKDMNEELANAGPIVGELPTIPDEAVDIHGMVKIGGGSGFIVHPDGIILTNKHVVIDGNAEYTVFLNDGRDFKATVLARDPIEDIAILKIDATKLPAIRLGNSSKVELGEEILAIGNALGLFKNTVSSGIVSGMARTIRAATDPKSPMQELRGLIQTDAAINPGNSGGPLVNMRGEAIGINAAIVFGAQNLSFALPINAAKRDLEDLKNHGRIRRPLLGLRYVVVDANLKDKMKLAAPYGALILGQSPQVVGQAAPLAQAIIPGSPAHKAGLQEKDLILECNGEKLSTEKTIADFLETSEVGDKMNLKLIRHGKEMTAQVVLAERK
jgi:S1-C subfamily serine protease